MTTPVLAANTWNSNAFLIADCHRLGYLRDDDFVLDPTYENGTWWKVWRPRLLVTHNRDLDGSDFRWLPYPANAFDAIAFDPPYVSKGGRSTSGIKEMDERYGQEDAPKTPALLQALINDGLTEMYRLVKPKGIVLVKCQSYVSSGRLWVGDYYTQQHALGLGLETIDRFDFVSKAPRPQPQRTRKDGAPSTQQHARRNISTLFVFRAPRNKT